MAGGGGGGGFGGLGGATFTATPNASGGVTITPNAPAQTIGATNTAGTRVSDVNTHTTYFTPADKAIVSNDNTDGFAIASRAGVLAPVGYYQTKYYSNVNEGLRDLAAGRIKQLDPRTQKVVDAMDRNMQPLNAPIDSVRWTSVDAVADNIGMKGAGRQQIINALANQDVIKTKYDYTSSSWDPKRNVVAGNYGRECMINIHYSKGAMVQFSPTRKEGEMVGARGVPQRFSNARYEWVNTSNHGRIRALVLDCYVD